MAHNQCSMLFCYIIQSVVYFLSSLFPNKVFTKEIFFLCFYIVFITMDARIQIHKKISYMIQGICARNGGINPMSASKVYLSLAMPRLWYGCQVWPINDHNVEWLERAHQDAARRLQGLPQQCAGPAATALMGWLSVQATTDMYRLIYLWTSLQIPNLFKKNLSNLLIETFHMPYSKRKKTGSLSTIVKTCHKYNIQDKVLSLLILNPNHITRE